MSDQDVQARAALKAGKISELATHDELKMMIREQRAFQGWQEGPLSFPPTFKFKLGSSIYIGRLLIHSFFVNSQFQNLHQSPLRIGCKGCV